MSNLFIGLLCAWVAASQSGDSSTVAAKTKPAITKAANASDPVEKEYRKLLEDDDAAQAEADKWIREVNASDGQQAGLSRATLKARIQQAGLSRATLKARIQQRFAPVRRAYEDFLQRHPKHVPARIAYGSFLNDIGEEEEAVAQWEKASGLDPQNPATWNNLANHYGHNGPVEKAFQYYEKAIELAPDEPLYLHNLATTTYLFRKDAAEYYKISEAQVFDRALDLYRRALKLDPDNFPLATDWAQSYYGIKPLRTDEALAAWRDALKAAGDDIEREGVYLHMARVELNSGRFDEARKHLGRVTNEMYTTLKTRLLRNLAERESKTPKAGKTSPAPNSEKE